MSKVKNSVDQIKDLGLCVPDTHIEDEDGYCVVCNSKNGYYLIEDEDSDLTFSKESYESYLGHIMTYQEWDVVKTNWYESIIGTIKEMRSDPNFEG